MSIDMHIKWSPPPERKKENNGQRGSFNTQSFSFFFEGADLVDYNNGAAVISSSLRASTEKWLRNSSNAPYIAFAPSSMDPVVRWRLDGRYISCIELMKACLAGQKRDGPSEFMYIHHPTSTAIVIALFKVIIIRSFLINMCHCVETMRTSWRRCLTSIKTGAIDGNVYTRTVKVLHTIFNICVHVSFPTV